MLLRIYRITDKLGIMTLKLGAAIADWLSQSAVILLDVTGTATGGVFRIILTIIMAIIGFFGFILRQIWRAISFVLGMAGIRVQQTGSTVRDRVEASTAEAMARRIARDEIDVTLKEDPLRVQNRRLSFLVLILGVAVLAAVIWATDPNRAQVPVVAPPNTSDVVSNPDAPIPTIDTTIGGTAPTAIPTATALPEPLAARGAIAYTVRESGQTDLWAVNVGSRNPIRITNNAADERDPEWNADGSRLAYAARIGNNWDIYIYDTFANVSNRLTVDLSFQANPTWSPDGIFVAYENYLNENLDIYAAPIDNSEPPLRITDDPAPDFSPAWSPDGRRIAFVSLREGNQDIWIFDLELVSFSRVTNTPNINEDFPAWSPDGRSIAYSAREAGALNETVFVQSLDDLNTPPALVAIGTTPTWSPDGSSIAYVVSSSDGRRTDLFAVTFTDAGIPSLIASVAPNSTAPSWTEQPLPATLVNAGGAPPAITEPLFIEQTDTFDGTTFELQALSNVQAEQPILSDAVNNAFNALREETLAQAGYDYLGALDDAFWGLERPADFGEPGRNWHRTGRAISLQRNGTLGFPPPIEIIREDIGNQTYWRVFVRVDEEFQRGQLGEPLRSIPWDFFNPTDNDVDSFNQGGRLRPEVPTGYYIDFTLLASDYGWDRIPASSDWVANERGRNFWMFIKDDDLTWCNAMLQLYTEGALVNYGCQS